MSKRRRRGEVDACTQLAAVLREYLSSGAAGGRAGTLGALQARLEAGGARADILRAGVREALRTECFRVKEVGVGLRLLVAKSEQVVGEGCGGHGGGDGDGDGEVEPGDVVEGGGVHGLALQMRREEGGIWVLVFEKSSGGASAGRFRWVEVAAVRRVCERLVGRGGVGRGVGDTASRSVGRGAVGDTGQGASDDDDDDDGGDDGRDDDASVAMVDVETNGGTPAAGTPGIARRRAVVLACGSLSPPTYAHLRLLEVARDALRERGWAADRGVLSPVHGAYAKPGLPAGYHRLAMARLAVAEAPGGWVRAGEFEVQRGKYSASWEVVDWARAEVGGGDFEVVFACGGDLFEAMCDEERWPPANVRKLLGRAFVAVVSRPGSDARDCLQNHVFAGLRDRVWFCDAVESGVSSSAVRELLAAGRSVQYLIPPAVESYVRDHGLYGCAGAPAANGTAAKPNGKS